MADVTRILELLDGLIDDIEAIKAEVANLGARAAAPAGRAADRAAAAAPELPDVILPTRTDDPDSIVGGKRVRRGDFPDCCAVGDDFGYFCTGTLIAPNVVVTAKHCGNATRVFLGGNDINRPQSGETIRVKKVRGDDGIEKTLVIPHPDREVDLEVLVLEEASSVVPRRVAQESELAGLTEVMLVGFGTIDLAGNVGYGIKRQVKVPVETFDCSEADVAARRGCRADFEIVAGQRGLRRDSCRGDSGGPLYIETGDGTYHLLGATSRGARGSDNVCGDGGIYVRVDKFLDWISEETGAEF